MNKIQYTKIIVPLVIGLNMAFAVAVLIVFWHTGAEPSALVGSWFAFTTCELWCLKDIKKSKIKSKE
jgi:hypothetical protein